jgi:hypothetical protein
MQDHQSRSPPLTALLADCSGTAERLAPTSEPIAGRQATPPRTPGGLAPRHARPLVQSQVSGGGPSPPGSQPRRPLEPRRAPAPGLGVRNSGPGRRCRSARAERAPRRGADRRRRRERGDLGAIAQAELGQDVGDVVPDGSRARVSRRAISGIGQTPHDQLRHLTLATGQRAGDAGDRPGAVASERNSSAAVSAYVEAPMRSNAASAAHASTDATCGDYAVSARAVASR